MEKGNNELFIYWLSTVEKRKSLKVFYTLKQCGCPFLLFFFHISPQAPAFTALGTGNINRIFRVKGSCLSFEESQKGLEKKKGVIKCSREVTGRMISQKPREVESSRKSKHLTMAKTEER